MAVKIKRAEGTVEFCEDLSLRAEWELKNEQLVTERATGTGRLVDPVVTQLAQEISDLENQMEDSTLIFRLRAVGRKRWAEAVAANPPREDNENDTAIGMNSGAVFDELLGEVGTIVSVTRKTTGEVIDFDPVAEWQELSDEMSDGQFADFGQKVFDLNRGVVARPFSQPASRVTAASASSSKQPSASE